MTIEQKKFLSILSDHLNRRATCLQREGLNCNAICSMARIHQMEGIVYYQCMGQLPPKAEESLCQSYAASFFYYANRNELLKKLFSEFDTSGIPHFLIKGPVIAHYYPVEALRTMGDTDIVVPSESREQVHELLLRQGFENTSRILDREWVYYYQNMEFELHDRLVYSENVNGNGHEDYFKDAWQYVENGQLSPDYHFIFLLFHLRKHLMNCGVGFRQFMDVAVMVKNESSLNWTWIFRELDKLQMTVFTERVLWLCHLWFGLDLPVEVPKPEDSFVYMATEQIFRNGVFGFDNQDNETKAAVNAVRGKSTPRIAMLLGLLRSVFPPYKAMAVVEHYSFLRGRPYLLPIAWIYRFSRRISGKSDRMMKDIVTSSFISLEEADKQDRILKEWGL